MSAYNPPGASPIYAAARQMLDAIAPGDSPSMGTVSAWVGTCHASVIRYGNEWALTLDDAHRIGRDTLATWAAAVEQPDGVWAVDMEAGGRVARLEWATDGEAMPPGGCVTWIGGAK